MGLYTYVKGTGFDAANSMAFNYVIDVIDVGGTGSKAYDTNGRTLSAHLLNTMNPAGQNQNYTVSVSGNTVSWNVPQVCKMLVYADTVPGADTAYNGFAIYDYSKGQRTVKLAPDFIPYNLTQIIDIGGGNVGAVIQTNVPMSMPIMVYHRSTDTSGMDDTYWEEVDQNGYRSFKLIRNTRATRFYIFSKQLVNTPLHGFFIYRNNQIVWHSNCLPLNSIANPGSVTSSNPLAISNGITAQVKIPGPDPAIRNGYRRQTLAAAGVQNGVWTADRNYIFVTEFIDNPQAFASVGTWTMGGTSYIDCSVYDAYYRQALGV